MNGSCTAEALLSESPDLPAVRGFLHQSQSSSTRGLVLAHGAGSNCNSPLLIALAEAFCAKGVTVLRCDLPFRQSRPHGPPLGTAEQDQAGLRHAIEVIRTRVEGQVFLGGHSYGGRMSSMAATQDPSLTDGLLLLSYPLHPPRKLQQMRTAHFPKLNAPALFAHGTRDPFGSIEEMESARRLIPATTKLVTIESAGHELVTKANRDKVVASVVAEFFSFFS
jgi:predicted alpha/beta-hydrolase family hydrolase